MPHCFIQLDLTASQPHAAVMAVTSALAYCICGHMPLCLTERAAGLSNSMTHGIHDSCIDRPAPSRSLLPAWLDAASPLRLCTLQQNAEKQE